LELHQEHANDLVGKYSSSELQQKMQNINEKIEGQVYCLNGKQLFKHTSCNPSATTLNLGIHKARTQISKFQLLNLKKTPKASSSTKKTCFSFAFVFLHGLQPALNHVANLAVNTAKTALIFVICT